MAATSTTISVTAYGISDGGYPTMVVIVDGTPVARQAVTGTSATYNFNVSLDLAAAHDVQVGFYDTNGQRALELQSIAIGGTTIQATDPRESYTSRVGTVTGSGDLRYGGLADFRLPAGALTAASGASTSTSSTTGTTSPPASTTPNAAGSTTTPSNAIVVSAHGVADSGGTFPALSLIVDGSPIGAAQTVTGTDAKYSFADKLDPTVAHTVQVAFYNTNGTRALALNSITVNGTTLLATDPSETYSSRVGTVHGSGDMRYGGVATFTVPANTATSTPTTTPTSGTTSSTTTGTTTGTTTTGTTTSSSSSTGSTTTPPATTSPVATAYYVSTTGSDGADGSFAHPFATLEHAVAAMKAGAIRTTYVEGGTYQLGATIALGASESGITIAGYNGQKPVLGSTTLASMVTLNGASNVTVAGLGFKPGGNVALAITGGGNNNIVGNFVSGGSSAIVLTGSSGNTLSGNEIDNSGLAGIELKDGSNNNLVDSNVINGTSSPGTQGGGIYAHGVANTTVSHNLVENTAGTGIAFENFDASLTINVGNTVSYNRVVNTGVATTYDTGAIYVLGRANVDTKMVIDHNDIEKSGAGGDAHTIAIYLDDDTNGVSVTNNIVRDPGTHAIELHNGHNDTIANNVFDLGTNTNSVAFIQTVPEGPANNMYGDTITRNIVESHKASQTGFEAFDGGVASISGNLYYSAAGGSIATSGSASDTSPVFGDPRFVDEPGGNYALGSGSAATAIGFKPIDQSATGLLSHTATWYS